MKELSVEMTERLQFWDSVFKVAPQRMKLDRSPTWKNSKLYLKPDEKATDGGNKSEL